MNVVAVPVFDHTDQVQSAASVSGPSYRMTPERFPEMAARLMGTAAEISRRLGYQASSKQLAALNGKASALCGHKYAKLFPKSTRQNTGVSG